MTKPNYRHFLKLFLKEETSPLIEEIREQESTRLRNVIDQGAQTPNEFFWFDTVDGKSVAINLALLQGVHFLWEPSPLPPDVTRYEGSIVIALLGRAQRIETHWTSPEQIYDFFTNLQHGPEVVPFHGFEDEDGERLMFRASEVVFTIAPLQVIEEGRVIAAEEDER